MPRTAHLHVQGEPEQDPDSFLDLPSDMEGASPGEPGTELEEQMVDADEELGEEEVEEEPPDSGASTLPPNVKEISSLASWSVSTSKPGCGVPQLRSPLTTSFWQTDGPAPHYLNIHFFKVVEIVAMRIFLDFDQDESYTPKEITFFAGMGEMDLQEWAVVHLVEPRGWINVDFEGVGAREGSASEDSDDEVDDVREQGDEGARRKKLPVLRAMLVQVKIVENHQNGKDSHLRGLQIFAKDKLNREKKISAAKKATSAGADASKANKAKMIPDLDFPEVELR